MQGIKHLGWRFAFCALLLSLTACQLPMAITGDTTQVNEQAGAGMTAPETLVSACSMDNSCGSEVVLTSMPLEFTSTPGVPTVNPFDGCNAKSDTLMESRILEIINQVRTKNGLGILAPETRLVKAALLHALDISCNGSVSHIGSDGSTLPDRLARQSYPYQVYAENIYAGGAGMPEVAVDAMMASAPHCANILNADFTEIGISFVVLDGSPYGSYYVIDFGAQ